MKKRHIALILTMIMVIACLCGCTKKEDTSAADAYLEMAQTFIDSNDYASAMEILQKGFAETQDSRIAVKMAELSAISPTEIATEAATSPTEAATSPTEAVTVPTTDSKTDLLESFIGTWADEEISWEFGGLICDIEATDSGLTIKATFLQSKAYRIAEFENTVSKENLRDNILEFTFDNDGWGNKGNVTMELSDSTMICTIKDVEYIGSEGFALWGIYEGEYIMTIQEDAYDKVATPEIEQDSQPIISAPPTLEERKNNCYMLALSWRDFMDDTVLNPVSYADLGTQHINMSFVPCETRTYYVICPRCLGNNHENGDLSKGVCQNDGYWGGEDVVDGIHYILQGDPNQAVLKPVTVAEVLTYPDGTLVYRLDSWEYGTANIYDHREDSSAPITVGTVIVPYMTYLGDVEYTSEFSMFACDFVY